MAALLALIVLCPQADADRVRDLIDRLGAGDVGVREVAGKDLLALPLRLIPQLAEAARKSGDAEVRSRVEAVLVPSSWTKVLDGSVGEARRTVSILAGREPGSRDFVAERVLTEFIRVNEGDVLAVLRECLASSERNLKEFALRGYAIFVPRDPGPIVALLEDETLASRAADVLVAAGEPSVRPAVLEIFCSRRPTAPEAGRVLAALGVGDAVGRVAALVRADTVLRYHGFAALERTGGLEAEKALLGMLDPGDPLGTFAAQALASFGSEAATTAILKFLGDPLKPDLKDIAEGRVWSLRDRVLRGRLDPGWAKTKLVELAGAAWREDSSLEGLADQVAAAGGPGLRDPVLARLGEPGLKVSAQNRIFPILGAVGGKGDAALLLERIKDPRLMEAAGDALDRMGDPSHARAIMAEFKKYTLGLGFGVALLGLPSTELQDDLEEILSDPHGYPMQINVALRLVERGPSPRVRDTILKGVLDDGPWWGQTRAWGTRILAKTARPEDKPSVEKMRAHEKADVKASGLILAMHLGDEGASGELCRLLSAKRLFTFECGDETAAIFEWIGPPGDAWSRAVLEEWKRRPVWPQGAIWLALRGNAEALKYLGENLDRLDERVHRPLAARALAARGDLGAQRRVIDRMVSRHGVYLDDGDGATLAAHALPEVRRELLLRVRLRMRGRPDIAEDPCLRVLALMAAPEAKHLFRATIRSEGSSRDSEGVAECARALARLKAADAAGDLRRLLRSGSPKGRAAALEALADLGDPGVVREAARLIEDPAEIGPEHTPSGLSQWMARKRLWHVAMDVLERVTGIKSEGASVLERREFWRAWHAKNK